MQDSINKTKTYLGFCIRSNAMIFGFDNIIKTKRVPKLVVFCKTANPKTIHPFLESEAKCIKLKDVTLSSLIDRENVKMVAVKNFSLAKAILTQKDVFEELN